VQLVDVSLSEGQLQADSDFGWHYYESGYQTATPIFAEPTRAQATVRPAQPTQQFYLPTLPWQAQPTATPIPWQVMPTATPNTTPYQ